MEKTTVVEKAPQGKLYVERLNFKPNDHAALKAEDDTFYFVIAGYGLMKVDAYGHNLEQETSVYMPAGTEHELTNTGDVELVLVRYGAKA